MTVDQTFDRSLRLADAHDQVRHAQPDDSLILDRADNDMHNVLCYRQVWLTLQSCLACRVPIKTSAHLPAVWLQHMAGTVQGMAKLLQASGRKGNMQRVSSMTTQPRFIQGRRRARGRQLDRQKCRQPHSWVRSSIARCACQCHSSRFWLRSNDSTSTSSSFSSRDTSSCHSSSNSWAAPRSGQQRRVASLASLPASSKRQPPQIGDHCSRACYQRAVLPCCSVRRNS